MYNTEVNGGGEQRCEPLAVEWNISRSNKSARSKSRAGVRMQAAENQSRINEEQKSRKRRRKDLGVLTEARF